MNYWNTSKGGKQLPNAPLPHHHYQKQNKKKTVAVNVYLLKDERVKKKLVAIGMQPGTDRRLAKWPLM